MTKVEELFEYMKTNGLRLGGLTRGSDPSTTTEEIANELLESLKSLEDGEFEVLADL